MRDFLYITDWLRNNYLKTNPKGYLTQHIGSVYRMFALSGVHGGIINKGITEKDLYVLLNNKGIHVSIKKGLCYILWKICPITGKRCCIKRSLCKLKVGKHGTKWSTYNCIKIYRKHIRGFANFTNYINDPFVQYHKTLHRKALLRLFKLQGVVIINDELIYDRKALKKYL